MTLLLYKFKLAVHLSIFVLKLSANFSNKVKPVIIGLFTVGLLVLILGISLFAGDQEQTENIVITSTLPRYEQLFNIKNLTKAELEEELIFWEGVSKIQPQSRDILLNISQVYSALQLPEKASQYKYQASKIDPNNPIFE